MRIDNVIIEDWFRSEYAALVIGTIGSYQWAMHTDFFGGVGR